MHAVQCNGVSCIISRCDMFCVEIETDNCWQNKNDFSLSRSGRYVDRKTGCAIFQNFRYVMLARAFIQYLFEAIFRAKSTCRDVTVP